MEKKNRKSEDWDADKYYEENIEPYLQSAGVRKMWNYFLEITRTDYFKDFIIELRRKYGIPENGFNRQDNYKIPPEGFVKTRELTDDIIKGICEKYRLHYFDYSDIIELYAYYNILQPMAELSAGGLFHVSDIVSEKEEPYGELFQRSDDMAYPIAIRISPYASQRDLIDFIENKAIWKNEIKFLQDKYKVKGIKIGKVKNKKQSIQERNDFIYENRHLHRKQIQSLVSAKFGSDRSVDYGYIGKIISLEKKKRKEV